MSATGCKETKEICLVHFTLTAYFLIEALSGCLTREQITTIKQLQLKTNCES